MTPIGYRETLEDILAFTGGKRLLTLRDVKRYTGIVDDRTAQRRYPLTDGHITAPTLALILTGGART
jgi:hypothetical protein